MRIRQLLRRGLVLPGFLLLCAGIGEARVDEPAGRSTQTSGSPLRITGSSTMCPMIAAISERFRTLRPEVRIEVQCGGSDRGIMDIREGNSDIGMISRALKPDEKGLFGFPMARDGVSIIVHAANPLTTLPDREIARIFSGEIDTWRALNGSDAPIHVILRESQKPVTELFTKYFELQGLLQGEVVPGDNPVTIAAVAANPAAVGYVSSGEAERNVKAGVAIHLVAVGGVIPTERNVITGNYPLTRPLSLVSRNLPVGPVKDFINYCLSAKVVDIIERFDFVPYED